MKRSLITAGILIAAGAFYLAGFSTGVVAMLAVAVALEIVFWMRVVRRKSAPAPKS